MDRFARADVSSAGGDRDAPGHLPGLGTHVPHQGGSFAWRTDEWYLARETLTPTKGRAGASEVVHDPSNTARVVGSALVAALLPADDPAAESPAPLGPHEPPGAHVSPESGGRTPVLPDASGASGSAPRPGASPLGRRRKGSVPRTCSAQGCTAHVFDRAQGLVVLCPVHRRVTSGVAVDTGDALMRWCYHCKKAHELSAFADSVIGLSRKLATCERGRAARRAAFAKKAAVTDGARRRGTAIEEQRPASLGDALDGSAHGGDGVPERGPTFARDAMPVIWDASAEATPAGGSAPFWPKSEAETLAVVASARARARPKRQQDLLDANPSRSGSSPGSGSPLGSGSLGSGSHGSGPYPGADVGGGQAGLLRLADAEVTDGNDHDLARANATVATAHHSPRSQAGHPPTWGVPKRFCDVHRAAVAAAAANWNCRAFNDVAFEVSTRASPSELVGEKRSVFEQMSDFVGHAVADHAPNERTARDHGSGSAAGANWAERLERAAKGAQLDGRDFFMDFGEVEAILGGDDAEPTLDSDPIAGSDQAPSFAGGDASHQRASRGSGSDGEARARAAAASRGWFDSLAATMLPGSTRVICTARAGFLERAGDSPGCDALPDRLSRGARVDAEALARSMVPGGALGRRSAIVTAYPVVRVGAGWAADDGNGESLLDGSRPDSVAVVCDADRDEHRVVRERTTPFPSYVTVPPFAALNDAIEIRGLRGGERVHCFGQGARPFSAVVPRGGGVDAVKITPPPFEVGAAGVPAVVPGFMYVQVLAPGQPATGAAFVKVLLVDDPAILAELEALGRGAGARAPAGAPSASAATRGFSCTAAFERFLHDLGALLESHWRNLLYTPAGRAATRTMRAGFDAVVADGACPALRAALAEVAEDVDAQRRFESDADASRAAAASRRGAPEAGLGGPGVRFYESAFHAAEGVSGRDASRRRASRRREKDGASAGTGTDGSETDLRAMGTIERQSYRFIETTATRTFSSCAAFVKASAPSRATRLAVRAALDDGSDIARLVFAGGETVAMTPQTRAVMYSRSMSAVTLFILVGIFRAEHWGMDPSQFVMCYSAWFPVFFVYVVAARDERVWRWLQRRSWMMGSEGALWEDGAARPGAPAVDRAARAARHAHAHDVCMFLLLMACNGSVRSTCELDAGQIQWRWINCAVLLIENAMMYSVLSAEYVRPGRTRFDIPAATVAAATVFACPPNTWTRLAGAASPASALAEQFLRHTHPDARVAALCFFALPCLAGAVARRAYRVHIRLALFAKLR